MASLRKLLGQTAIYGFTHVLGRVLNFALTPLYTYTFIDAESLAPVWLFYAYIGFITIVLQHAMAIAFFRFAGKDNQDKDIVFGTAMCSVMAISLFAGIGLSLFSQEVAAFAGQPGKGSWVRILGWVLALDAIAYLPLARLRFDERPTSFAGIQITEIVTNLS
ncbi:MAG: polysaccharide biosynthesis protein, partial [Bacteroidota bacterium]|nr:polysaccharide biosynthesis protein [Bacteroidota bacterium]